MPFPHPDKFGHHSPDLQEPDYPHTSMESSGHSKRQMQAAFDLPEHDYKNPDSIEIHKLARPWSEVLIALTITPLQTYRDNLWQVDKEFLTCCILWIFGIIPAVLYYYYKQFVQWHINILCVVLPPLGLGLDSKKVDKQVVICLGLDAIFFILVVLSIVIDAWWLIFPILAVRWFESAWAYKHIS